MARDVTVPVMPSYTACDTGTNPALESTAPSPRAISDAPARESAATLRSSQNAA